MNSSINGASQTSPKGKKRGRFNFIDAILIILAVLVAGALVYVFSPVSLIKNLTGRNTRSIQYEIELTDVDEAFIDKIKANDQVLDGVSKGKLGSVTMVDYNTKYSEYRFDEIERKNEVGETVTDYTVTPIEYPNRYNVIVTIVTDASYEAGVGYSINSTRIAVGEKLYLNFPDYRGEGYCVGITEY